MSGPIDRVRVAGTPVSCVAGWSLPTPFEGRQVGEGVTAVGVDVGYRLDIAIGSSTAAGRAREAPSRRLSAALGGVRDGSGGKEARVTRSHLSVRVELVAGRALVLWPRPGRILAAARSATFDELAAAIDAAFARWDLAHLHTFDLADGTLLHGPGRAWDEPPQLPEPRDVRRSDAMRLSRLAPGEQFVYVFDQGDGWEHLCRVGDRRVDPLEVLGDLPARPVPYWGWGTLPDQYGRRWETDTDDDAPVPPAPTPPLADLPPLYPGWGRDTDRPE